MLANVIATWMQCERNGTVMTPKQAEWAVKKYKSHRRIQIDLTLEEYEEEDPVPEAEIPGPMANGNSQEEEDDENSVKIMLNNDGFDEEVDDDDSNDV